MISFIEICGARRSTGCMRPITFPISRAAVPGALRRRVRPRINDDPVTIKSIEPAIVDRAFDEGWIGPRRPRSHRHCVAVVGSGRRDWPPPIN